MDAARRKTDTDIYPDWARNAWTAGSDVIALVQVAIANGWSPERFLNVMAAARRVISGEAYRAEAQDGDEADAVSHRAQKD